MKNSSPSFDEYRQIQHFDALDGMRAIGVVLVIFQHYGGDRLRFLSGWLGVHVFFIISGFLITTLLLREQEENGKVSLLNFYIRRLFRIAPVYYLLFCITTVQTYALGGESWEQLKNAWPYYATFLNEQDFIAPWKITWTLGIEWKYYLAWPLVAFLLPLNIFRLIIVTAITLVILFWFWGSKLVLSPHYIVLLTGSIVAILMHYQRSYEVLRCLMNPAGGAILLLCVIFMQIWGIRYTSELEGGYGGAIGPVMYGFIVAIFIPTLFISSRINKILSSRLFVFIGQRSYSLYLVQILAWQALVGMDPTMRVSPTGAILTTLVGLIFADALYRYVEKPMIVTGKKILLKVQSKSLKSTLQNETISLSTK